MRNTLLFVLSVSALLACSDDDTTPVETTGDTGTTDVSNDASDTAADTAVDTALDSVEDVALDGEQDVAEEDIVEEFAVSDDDFSCLTEWEGVRGFYMTNLLGNTAEAIRIAEEGFVESAPVGTVVQLIPQEAMVKLPAGTSPATNDWEYFILQNNPGGSAITERGFEDISNVAGTCNGCHVGAAERDFICEDTLLCAAAALPRALVDSLVENDPRCD
ncbi:MAG: hypothetical protein ACJAYU_000739 [Bradymonadia bacterium]|jgi:hypothetical protein